MPWLPGTDMQLRRPDMEQMLEEHKKDPRGARRRGCVTCLALIIAWIGITVVWVILSIV